MSSITNKSLKDSDINLDLVKRRLSIISDEIKNNNIKNLTDINIICEDIFGQILNKLYDLDLKTTSSIYSGNYVAIDLVDKKRELHIK